MNPQVLSEQEQEKAKQEIAKAFGIDKEFNVDCSRAKGFFLIDNITHIENGVVIHDGERLRIDKFDFALLMKYPLMFAMCDFECAIGDIFFYSPNYKTLRFFDCTFKKRVSLGGEDSRAMFYQIEKCIFEDRVEINGRFDKNVFFTNNIFKSSINCRRSFFEKQASFYGSTFKECPNFTQCHFEGNVNLINTNLVFDYKSIKQEICKEVGNRQNNFKISQGSKVVANDFRDSFRLFKNALSKEGNLLDASNYHRVELYCKEIELDSKNPSMFSKDWIDKWQLFFYRHTSDHHTDLLKILGWILMAIACFGVSLGMSRYGLDFGRFTETYHLGFFSYTFSQVAMWFSTDLKHICAWFYNLFFLSLIFPLSRFVVSFGVVCLMIATQPKYILGIGGFIGGSVQAQNMGENFLFVIYSLLMFLMLFSLQKTARKNSIIPS